MAHQVGERVIVRDPYSNNQVGGTIFLKGTFHAVITKTWYDYEIGQRYIGELFEESEIKQNQEAGKTKYTPEHYKQHSEEMYQDMLKLFNSYNPKIIYFGEHQIMKQA